ncbi:MAG: Rieske 2Fe-2S domain-containing protein [Alphaproteobacteria bacterium]|nr:Rieske 2Fe-2S domain-containing protein [Alphaproteobacteria bacterium]
MICDNVGPIVCGHVDDFAVGSVKTFVKGKFCLVRLEGGFLALSRWCTHLNGLLSWKKEHWEFYCPMHGARFDRTGMPRPLARPCPPLRIHPVTVTEAGEVVVDPDTAIRRDGFSPDQLVPADGASAPAVEASEGA